jgi:hypothetical protein
MNTSQFNLSGDLWTLEKSYLENLFYTKSLSDNAYVSKTSQVKTTGPLFVNLGSSANIDGGFNLSIAQANNVTGGFLTATDWNTFNNKLDTTTGQIFNDSNAITTALTTYYYNVSSVNITRGTASGNLNETNTYNSVSYNISEQGGAVGLNVSFIFNNLTSVNQIIFRYKTSSNENHISTLFLWDYDDNNWESYSEIGAVINFGIFTFPIFDSDAHIQNGTLKVKIESLSNGNTAHRHQFDWIQLSKGIATPSSTETDPYSLHLTGGNVTGDTYFNNLTTTDLNITNNFNINGENGTLNLNGGLSGGLAWNTSDLCMVSAQNSTGFRNIFCITKPSG